ncbi:unnamed protein product [Adineta steineri]|uniref:Uncharacterized protein n=1 Tax=Adineta steineri TaxID=433720 RepID=A0A814XF40_9BILA|nr:unnamed protein product [Adineta steineri]
MTIPYGKMANTSILNNITKKSSTCFSYLIQPITPCIFGNDNFDGNSVNDDEFFLTAGGIIHSCPNIYELSINNQNNYRKFQSCNHLLYINKQTTSILNMYNTDFDHYSIKPRCQPISTSISTDSNNSDIELYKERHAMGLSRKHNTMINTYSSFLPTTWKSENYLFFISFLHHQSLLSSTVDSNRRSRSYEFLIE